MSRVKTNNAAQSIRSFASAQDDTDELFSLEIRNAACLATPLGASARQGPEQGEILRVRDAALRAENGRIAIPRGSAAELYVRVARDNDLILDLESIVANGQRYAIGAQPNRSMPSSKARMPVAPS